MAVEADTVLQQQCRPQVHGDIRFSSRANNAGTVGRNVLARRRLEERELLLLCGYDR